MKFVLWYELNEEAKRKALSLYGRDKIEEYDYMDALFDEEGYCLNEDLM